MRAGAAGRIAGWLLGLVVLAGGGLAPPASAHRSPANCNANGFNATFGKDRLYVKNGESITYDVQAENQNSSGIPCDVSDLTVRVYLPNADGQVSTTSYADVFSNATVLSQQAPVATHQHLVNLNPGVTYFQARSLVINAVLHDGPGHPTGGTSQIYDSRYLSGVRPIPGIAVQKTATPTEGVAPQTTTYDFSVQSTTTAARPLDNVSVSDDKCSTLTRPTPNGDTNNDNRLDSGESWLYRCTTSHGPGEFTNTVTACGTLFVDSGPTPQVCDTDKATVVYDAPERGVRRGYAFDSYRLTDRASMAVDIANGNLRLTSQDLQVAGTRMDLAFTRYFNSQEQASGELGRGGRFSLGRDIELDECDLSGHPDSRCMITAGGVRAQFKRDGNGDYDPPASMKTARLVENNDGTFTLTDRGSGTKMYFAAGAQSYMSRIEDKYGNTIDPDYVTGADGHLESIRDTQGRDFEVEANAKGDITKITDGNLASDREWVYAYHPGTRRLASVTSPEGEVTQYGYDDSGRLTTITDPMGTVIAIEYDNELRVKKITRPGTTSSLNDAVTRYAYETTLGETCDDVDDAEGQTEVTDPRGYVTTYCWDDRGRVLRTEDADENRRGRTYNQQDDVEDYTELEGLAAKEFEFTYGSSSNRLTGGNSPAGEAFNVQYCGQTVNGDQEPACKGNDVDEFSPTSIKRNSGASTYMEYNSQGDVEYVGSVRSSSNVWPADKARLKWRDGDAGYTPTDGQLHWSEDGNGNRTEYHYDNDGNLEQIDPPGDDIKPTVFTSDDVSRITSVRDGRHFSTTEKQIESIEYDDLDRVLRVTYGDDSYFKYEYDANGNLTKRADYADDSSPTPLHETSYTYNKRNERTTESVTPGTAFNAYVWDKAGNLTGFQDSAGTVLYRYDPINRVDRITEPSNAIIDISHDDDARTTTVIYPGNIKHVTEKDKSGKLTAIRIKSASGNDLRVLDYDYHADACGTPTGQRSQVQRLIDDNNQAGTERRTCYSYDSLSDRLTEVVTRNGSDGSGSFIDSWNYAHDAAGNRTYKIHSDGVNAQETSYAYGVVNQLCWRADGDHRDHGGATDCSSPPSGAVDYDHDASGNEIDEDPGRTAGYDIRNRMTELNGEPLEYLSATNADLIAFDGESYFNNLLGIGTNSGTAYTRNPDTSAALGQRTSTGTQYLLSDRIGSTIGLITASSTDVDRTYRYDPDGNADGPSTGTGPGTELRFAGGHLVDGLYHFGARFYDPDNARWTQQDPLNAPGDLKNANRYGYVGGDPVNGVDPQGLFLDNLIPDDWLGGWASTVWGCVNPADAVSWRAGVVGFGIGFQLGYWSASDLGVPAAGVGVGAVSGAAGAAIGYKGAQQVTCALGVADQVGIDVDDAF